MEESTIAIEGAFDVKSSNKRHIAVCIQNACNSCPFHVEDLPSSCEYRILHLLDLNPSMGLKWQARRSGKTTKLVSLANDIAKWGHSVYFITASEDMGDYVRHSFDLEDRVRVMSQYRALSGGLVERPGGFIITDEINPSAVENIQMHLRPNRLAAGFYT